MAQRTSSATSLPSLRKRRASAVESVVSRTSEGGCAPRWTLWFSGWSIFEVKNPKTSDPMESSGGGSAKRLCGKIRKKRLRARRACRSSSSADLRKSSRRPLPQTLVGEAVDFVMAQDVHRMCSPNLWATMTASPYFLLFSPTGIAENHIPGTFVSSEGIGAGPPKKRIKFF